MGVLDRLRQSRLAQRVLGPSFPEEVEPPEDVWEELEDEPQEGELDEDGRRSGITGWVEERAHSVVSRIYDSRADDLEDRAKRAVSSAYRESADDLESRAVSAMRRALTEEAERIKEMIEASIRVKKREVRLSLLVLVLAAVIYLALYWVTLSKP